MVSADEASGTDVSIFLSLAGGDDDGTNLSRAGGRLFLTFIAISAIVFVACIPYVRLRLQPVPAFVAVYNSVLMVNNFTTSIILFGQFNILPSRAVLVLASGYLFTAAITAVQLLTYPHVFAATGLLGAGPQTAAWLYMFWHGGFPLAVVLYALSRGRGGEPIERPRIAVASGVATAMGAVLVCWLASAWGTEGALALPMLIGENGFTQWHQVCTVTDMTLALGAFAMLWLRRRRTALDVWLMVVMGYWLCDVTLSSYLNASRYDLGYYAGRLYGALAASFLLAILVLQNSRLYRGLAVAASRLNERTSELMRANATLQGEIADRKRGEDELRRAQMELADVTRVTAMGELTASLAHEVNQPIGAAVANAESCLIWLSGEVPNIEEARAAASAIVKNGIRAAEIMARIRELFKKGTPQRESVDLNDVIREMTVLLRGETTRCAVSLGTELAADLPQVLGDRMKLQQVMMNLIINGVEAMKDVDGTRDLVIRSQRAENGQISVSVSDTGVGLPLLHADLIFTALFTTKPHSTGMGLSVCRAIIEAHGGRLWAVNNSSRGASFHFVLPAKLEVPE